jgi:hypothetical protein
MDKESHQVSSAIRKKDRSKFYETGVLCVALSTAVN